MTSENDSDLRTALKAYSHLSSQVVGSISSLECLLQSFEASYIQNAQASTLSFYKALIFNSVYQHIPELKNTNETIYFWPFQFHHCDFMVPVIKQLRENGAQVRVLVFRPNLIPYLKELGMDGDLITFSKKARSLFSMVTTFMFGIKYHLSVLKSGQGNRWKNSALRVFQDLSMAQKATEAAARVALFGGAQYHMVGHDIALQGRAIIGVMEQGSTNTTARIQNGAVNYMLCPYSKVNEAFFWDSVSHKAYQNSGWEGRGHVVGNIKLCQKVGQGVASGWMNWLKTHPFQKRILVAFSGAGHKTTLTGHKKSLEFLKILVEASPEVGYVIKLHPKDKVDYYDKLKELANVVVTAHLEGHERPDALDGLMSCQALITGGSSVALDALALKVPVISIDPLGEMVQFEFLKEDGVTMWEEISELGKIRKLVAQLPIGNFDARENKNPIQRIVEVITEKIKLS